ncbi:ring-opening amidohydrolase [Pelagicoccus albus]|uniref:Cyclic amide hydrolase n=1 Tax=Pelagicoccus albus TaxID=415222 RepID=A0A7X1E9I8_9BACT|nr:ring-opening amidohydrolase [Pelagicoccus albus]MBC2607910.1 ring-opening amidohydrolase [Pelagicoccus albus]
MKQYPTAKATRLTMKHPGDLSALDQEIIEGRIKSADIVAIIGKTEGNGGVNDFTRGYFTQSLMLLLSKYLDATIEELAEKIPCVLSGGTEGVLSPHYVVLTRSQTEIPPASGDKALALGVAMTRPIEAWEIGTETHWKLTLEAVKRAMEDAQISNPDDVSFVQLKCPCFTVAAAKQAVAAGKSLCSGDPNRAMALSRVAGAWGVALALGELSEDQLSAEAMLSDYSLFSNRASVSSGVEVSAVEVIVLGNSPDWSGHYQIDATSMVDALDLDAVLKLRETSKAQTSEVCGVLVKCEPDRRGQVRGFRHTMLDDTDINAQRHIRGALGGLVASVFGDGRIFVSGGAEHQGPDGGGLVAVITKRP